MLISHFSNLLDTQVFLPIYPQIVLKKNKKVISIYIFSYDHTVDESDFEDIPKVKIKPIPEVILNVYRKIFKELYKPKEI